MRPRPIAIALVVMTQMLFSNTPATAQAQGGLIVGTLVVGEGFRQLKDKVGELIDDAKYVADTTSLAIFQKIMIAIQEAERAFHDQLSFTFQQADKAVGDFYGRTNGLIDRLSAEFDKQSMNLREIGEEASRLASDLPFGAKAPRVFRHLPDYVVDREQKDPVRLEIVGKNLAHGPIEVSLKGSEGQPQPADCPVKGPDRVQCFLPRAAFTTASDQDGLKTLAWRTVLLRVHDQQSWSDWARSRQPIIEHNMLVYVLPATIGQYVVDFTATREKQTLANRTETVDVRSRSNTSDYRYEWVPFHAGKQDPGDAARWFIIPDSLTFGNVYGKSGDIRGFKHVTDKSFCFELGAKGQGFGKGRGHQAATLSWREFKKTTERIETDPKCRREVPYKVSEQPARPVPLPKLSLKNLGFGAYVQNLSAFIKTLSLPEGDCLPSLVGPLFYGQDVTLRLPQSVLSWEVSILKNDGTVSKAIAPGPLDVAAVDRQVDRLLIKPILKLPDPRL